MAWRRMGKGGYARWILAVVFSLALVKLSLILILITYGFVRIEAPLVRVEYGPLRFYVEIMSNANMESLELPHISLSFLTVLLIETVAVVNLVFRAWRGEWTEAGLSGVLVYAADMMIYLNTRHLYSLVATRIVKVRVGNDLIFLNLPKAYSGEVVALASLAVSLALLISVTLLGLREGSGQFGVESAPYLSAFAMLVVVAVVLSHTSLQITPPRVSPPSISWNGDNSGVIVSSRMKDAVVQLVELYVMDTGRHYYRLAVLHTSDSRVEIPLKPVLVTIHDSGIDPVTLIIRTKIYYPDGSVGESLRELPIPLEAKTVNIIYVTIEYEFAYTKITFDPLGCKYVERVEVIWSESGVKGYAPVRGEGCTVVFPTLSLRATFKFYYVGVDGNVKSMGILLTPGVHSVGLPR